MFWFDIFDFLVLTMTFFPRLAFIVTKRRLRHSKRVVLGIASSAVIVTGLSLSRSTTELEESNNEETAPLSYQIEVDFVEKLAAKPYLHFSKDDYAYKQRPEGIPSSLRILAVDLPETRRAFSGGECRLALDHVFPDGIAPPRKVLLEDNEQPKRKITKKKTKKKKKASKKDALHLKVEQKAWVKSMYQCVNPTTHKVGIQLLEADTAALNPHNVRKTHQFGMLKYDPGKYTDEQRSSSLRRKETSTVVATPQDELEAPWNQQAWMEELELRISGQVEFGVPMQASGRWSRYFFGNVYQSTIPSSRSWWSWTNNSSSSISSSDPAAGIDGKGNNWASNKPHAVIANGLMLQRVPNSLRLLQKCCRQHNVPLYVILDPRTWGGNTHHDLEDVLRDLRRTVKREIVTTALQQAAGTAFQRGRWLGSLETESKWQAKEVMRKTQDALERAKQVQKQLADYDWSQLDEHALLEKLMSRGVVRKQQAEDAEPKLHYTDAMITLARRCIDDQQDEDKQKEDADTTP